MLIYNRHARSTRRLCNLAAVTAALEARGLSHAYADVPASACEQVAALAQPHRFVITPHGAHEARACSASSGRALTRACGQINLFAVAHNTTVVEVMPRWTDIPIYNRLVPSTVFVVSEQLERAFRCTDGACEPLPASYGACTRVRRSQAAAQRRCVSDGRLAHRTRCAASLRGTGHA